MIEKVKQYKNLILIAVAILLIIGIITSDPLGYVAERRHQRALIQNQIAVEKAEAEKQIAIIRAQTDAELERIRNGQTVAETEEETAAEVVISETAEETE